MDIQARYLVSSSTECKSNKTVSACRNLVLTVLQGTSENGELSILHGAFEVFAYTPQNYVENTSGTIVEFFASCLRLRNGDDSQLLFLLKALRLPSMALALKKQYIIIMHVK